VGGGVGEYILPITDLGSVGKKGQNLQIQTNRRWVHDQCLAVGVTSQKTQNQGVVSLSTNDKKDKNLGANGAGYSKKKKKRG